MTRLIENAPALKLDEVLHPDGKIPVHVVRERRVVWNLLLHLGARGWNAAYVDDGDTETRVRSTKGAMELIFNLDDARVVFKSKRNPLHIHTVLLVLGNDLDVVSDWNFTTGDPDGFSAAMDAFDAEKFA